MRRLVELPPLPGWLYPRSPRRRRCGGRAAPRVTVVLLSCSIAACADPPSALDIEVRFSPTPPAVGPARLLVELRDSLSQPVTGASVRVEGRPSGGSLNPATVVQAEEQAADRYVVSTYDFTVPGRWTLWLRARTASGLEVTRRIETPVYTGPPGGSGPRSGR